MIFSKLNRTRVFPAAARAGILPKCGGMRVQVAEVLAGVNIAALSSPGEDAQVDVESNVIAAVFRHSSLRPVIFGGVDIFSGADAHITFPACLPHCSFRCEVWHAELSNSTGSKVDGFLKGVL